MQLRVGLRDPLDDLVVPVLVVDLGDPLHHVVVAGDQLGEVPDHLGRAVGQLLGAVAVLEGVGDGVAAVDRVVDGEVVVVVVRQSLYAGHGDVVEPGLDVAAAAELVHGEVPVQVVVVQEPAVLVGPVVAGGRAVVVVEEADLLVFSGRAQVPPELLLADLEGVRGLLPCAGRAVLGLEGDNLDGVAGGAVAGRPEIVFVQVAPGPQDRVHDQADLDGHPQIALVPR